MYTVLKLRYNAQRDANPPPVNNPCKNKIKKIILPPLELKKPHIFLK